jgi:hypothetical protein
MKQVVVLAALAAATHIAFAQNAATVNGNSFHTGGCHGQANDCTRPKRYA